MNWQIASISTCAFLSRFGHRLTSFGGLLFLTYYGSKLTWVILLLASQVLASFIASRSQFLKERCSGKHLPETLFIQALLMLILTIFSDNLILFVCLFFVKSALNSIYLSQSQAILPMHCANKKSLHTANRIYSLLISLSFLLSLVLSGLILENYSISYIFFVDFVVSLISAILGLVIAQVSLQDSCPQIEEVSKAFNAIQKKFALYPIYAGVFLIFFFGGAGTILETYYFKNTLLLTPYQTSLIFFATGLGNVMASFILTDSIIRRINASHVFLVASVMNILFTLIFFQKGIYAIAAELFFYGILNGVFIIIARDKIYAYSLADDRLGSFLMYDIVRDCAQLLSLGILVVVGSGYTNTGMLLTMWGVGISLVFVGTIMRSNWGLAQVDQEIHGKG